MSRRRTFIKSNHIDKVINFHKNSNTDIILPNLKVSPTNNTNIIKIVTNKNEVMYLSRANIPYEFKKINILKNIYQLFF